jgi:serine/threonine protein kinase
MSSRFQIIRKLGEGGMATVYLAEPRAGTPGPAQVALKKMRREAMDDPEQIDLFLREARVATRFDHPGLVRVFDAGLEGNELFLSLEYVDGPDLEQVIDLLRSRGERLAPELVAFVGARVCEALSHVKTLRDDAGAPLVQAHRDISPSNVLLSRQGQVKLADFGVVRLTSSKTAVGIVKGKWEFFPPEIITGKPQDMRGDLFALGITLYKLAALEHPFFAPTPQEHFQRARTEDPQRPRGMPEGLWLVLRGALARDPDLRHPTPEAMAQELEGFIRSRRPVATARVLAEALARLRRNHTDSMVAPEPTTDGDGDESPTLPELPRSARAAAGADDDDDEESTETGIPGFSAPSRPPPVGRRSTGMMPVAQMPSLYDLLKAARQQAGLPMEHSPEQFAAMLQRREAEIQRSRPGARVEFAVVTREGKPVVVPRVRVPKSR